MGIPSGGGDANQNGAYSTNRDSVADWNRCWRACLVPGCLVLVPLMSGRLSTKRGCDFRLGKYDIGVCNVLGIFIKR